MRPWVSAALAVLLLAILFTLEGAWAAEPAPGAATPADRKLQQTPTTKPPGVNSRQWYEYVSETEAELRQPAATDGTAANQPQQQQQQQAAASPSPAPQAAQTPPTTPRPAAQPGQQQQQPAAAGGKARPPRLLPENPAEPKPKIPSKAAVGVGTPPGTTLKQQHAVVNKIKKAAAKKPLKLIFHLPPELLEQQQRYLEHQDERDERQHHASPEPREDYYRLLEGSEGYAGPHRRDSETEDSYDVADPREYESQHGADETLQQYEEQQRHRQQHAEEPGPGADGEEDGHSREPWHSSGPDSSSEDDMPAVEADDNEGYDAEGYDAVTGYDELGYDKQGYDQEGWNRLGYNRAGYQKEGYDADGFDLYGFDRAGYDRTGYDAEGYNRHGVDEQGNTKDGGSRTGDAAADVPYGAAAHKSAEDSLPVPGPPYRAVSYDEDDAAAVPHFERYHDIEHRED